MALTHKSTWWQFVLSYLLWLMLVSVGQKMCCDPECEQPISWGQTTTKFMNREDKLLAYYKWEFITIFSKNVEYNGKKMWDAQVRGMRGYILPAAVKEFFVEDCEPKYVESSQSLHSTKIESSGNNFQDIFSPSSIEADTVTKNEDKGNSISKKETKGSFVDKAEKVEKTSSYSDNWFLKRKARDAEDTIIKNSLVIDAGEKHVKASRQGYSTHKNNAVKSITNVNYDSKAVTHGFDKEGGVKGTVNGNNNDALDVSKDILINDHIYFTPEKNVVEGITENSDNSDSLKNIEFCEGYEESECQEKMAEVKKSLLLWFQELGDDKEHELEDSKIVEEYGTLDGQNYMKKVDMGNFISENEKTVEEDETDNRHELSNSDMFVYDNIDNEKYITKNMEKYSELLHINSNVEFDIHEKTLNIPNIKDGTNIYVMDLKANSSKVTNISVRSSKNTSCLQSFPDDIFKTQKNRGLDGTNQGNDIQHHYPISSNTSLFHDECSINISNNDIAKNEKLRKVTDQKSAATQKQFKNEHNGSNNTHTSHFQEGDDSLVSKLNINSSNGTNNNISSKVTTSYSEGILNKRKLLCQDHCKKDLIRSLLSDNQKSQNQNINNDERVQFFANFFPSWILAKRVTQDVIILLFMILTISSLILLGIISWSYRKTFHELKKERAGHIQAVARIDQAMAEQQLLLRRLEDFKHCNEIHEENEKKFYIEKESLLQQKLNLEKQIEQISRTLQQSKLNVDKYWSECAQLKCKLSQLEQQHSELKTENQKNLADNKLLALQIKKTSEDMLQKGTNRKVSMKVPKFRTPSKSHVAPNVPLQKDRRGPMPQFTIYHQTNNGHVNHSGLYRSSYYPPQPQVAIDMSQYEHLYQPSNMSRVAKYVDEEIPVETSSQQTPSSQGWQTSTHFV